MIKYVHSLIAQADELEAFRHVPALGVLFRFRHSKASKSDGVLGIVVTLHQDLDVAFGLLNLLQLLNQVANRHVVSFIQLISNYTYFDKICTPV